MRLIHIIVLATFLLLPFPTLTYAETEKGFCVTTQEAMKAVASEKEKLVFRGMSKRGHLVTIYLGPKRTFTALIHYPTGKSCFVDFGGEGEIIGETYERS